MDNKSFQDFLKVNENEKKLSKEEKKQQLEKFTDPICLQEKKKKTAARCKDNANNNKTFAIDTFNEDFTQKDIDLIQSSIMTDNLVTNDFLIDQMNKISIDYIDFTYKPSGGFGAIFEYIKCASICKEWLAKNLKLIGWKQNMSNYDPIAVSNSCSELQNSTIECYKMCCKQMINYLKFIQKN